MLTNLSLMAPPRQVPIASGGGIVVGAQLSVRLGVPRLLLYAIHPTRLEGKWYCHYLSHLFCLLLCVILLSFLSVWLGIPRPFFYAIHPTRLKGK
jgi:hypothetical protein